MRPLRGMSGCLPHNSIDSIITRLRQKCGRINPTPLFKFASDPVDVPALYFCKPKRIGKLHIFEQSNRIKPQLLRPADML